MFRINSIGEYYILSVLGAESGSFQFLAGGRIDE